MLRSRSEEQSWIDATNKRLKRLYEWIPAEDNKYIAAWERALNAADVDYQMKTKNGQQIPVIKNNAENRAKVDELRRQIEKKNARSLSDIREQAKQDLRDQGQKLTKANIDEKLKDYQSYATLQSNAEFVYEQERKGNYQLSHYTDILRGKETGTKAYTQNVRDLAQAVADYRENERKNARKSVKRRRKRKVNEESPY